MKAVIYSRVSTEKQETGNQIAELTAWAERLGLDVIEVYRENETAWKAGHQRELRRLFDAAYKRKFDVVLIWALDRLTREGVEATFRYYNKLLQFGIPLYSYTESWTMQPGNKMMTELLLAITGWVSKYESQRRSDRTKAGMAYTLSKGVTKAGKPISKLGRPAGSKDKKTRKRRIKIYVEN